MCGQHMLIGANHPYNTEIDLGGPESFAAAVENNQILRASRERKSAPTRRNVEDRRQQAQRVITAVCRVYACMRESGREGGREAK